MKIEEFTSSLSQTKPPASLNKYLKILWYDATGKWDIAHSKAQSIYNRDGSLLHAYLHRKEGDLVNAAYWYSNADVEMPEIPLFDEWKNLVKKYINFNE